MPFISSVRGRFGGLGKTGLTAPYALIAYAGTTYNMASSTITFSTPGEYSIVLPYASRVRARVWGAGGGGSQPGGWGAQSVGGSGGFSTGIVSLPAGTSKVLVGEGGNGNTARFVFGGGRSAQPGAASDNRYSACGGGFSGILSGSGVVHDSTPSVNNNYRTAELQARSIIIAGGGGGGGNRSGGSTNNFRGGHGGGSSGTGGVVDGSVQSTTAGTQTSAGSNSFGDQWGGRIAAAFMGGSSGSGEGYGGGGGGGYFGGSSGENSSYMSGAGGGSGFIHPTLVTSGSTTAGSAQTSPGGDGVTGYIGGVGYGGSTGTGTSNSPWTGGAGGGGLVILTVI
jgi:hypothetical protein